MVIHRLSGEQVLRATDLLREVGLPSEDLGIDSNALLYGIEIDGQLVGLVGLEAYAGVGLLRSLAVSPRCQGTGLGGQLLQHAERVASEQGIESLYLLTTSAEPYFQARGYVPASRRDAPLEIAATSQFAGLCPATAAFMVKRKCAPHPDASQRQG